MRGTEAFTGESSLEFLLHVIILCGVAAGSTGLFAYVIAGFTLRFGIWPVAAVLGFWGLFGSLYSSFRDKGYISGEAWQEGIYWVFVFITVVTAAGGLVRWLGADRG